MPLIPNVSWHESKRLALRGTSALPTPGFRRWQQLSKVSNGCGMSQQGILGIDMQMSGAECVWVGRGMPACRFGEFLLWRDCQFLSNEVTEEQEAVAGRVQRKKKEKERE